MARMTTPSSGPQHPSSSGAAGAGGADGARHGRRRAESPVDRKTSALDGWSVLRALKGDPALAAIPVVMVTIIDEQRLAFSLGAADYLSKPIEWDHRKAVMGRFKPGQPGGALIVDDDPDLLLRVGISVWERYTGPYTEDMRPFVDQMMNNRIAVRLVPTRTRSWDHRKLGMGEMPVAGSTAQYLS